MSVYWANQGGIRQGGGALGEAGGAAEALPGHFAADCDQTDNWWGVEGGNDDFANQVGPQVRAGRERFTYVLDQLQQIPLLVDVVLNEGNRVQNPQNDALGDISDQGGLHDDPSGSAGRR